MTMLHPRTAVALALLALTACSGKTTPTTPPISPSSLAISAGSATVTVAQAATQTQAVTIVRTNFAGTVDLTAEGLPGGVTATFAPASLTAGATGSTLTLSAGATATVGTATVTVRARGTGVTDAIASLPVSILAAIPGSSVTLTASDTAASVLPGDSTGTTIAITRSAGYTGAVTMTVTGAPSGMTTTFSSANPVLGPTIRLSLSTTTAVVPGTYTLTARANAAGISEATASVTVRVVPRPSNSVAWTYCSSARIPVWFAYQDGLSGVWRRVTPSPAGTFTFAVDQPRVGVATVSIEPGVTVTRVRWVGLTELAAEAAAECIANPVPGTRTVTGTVSGLSTGDVATVAMGPTVSNALTQSTPAFTLARVPDGLRDLIVVLSSTTPASTLRLLLQRDLDPVGNASLGTLDLFGTRSFVPAFASLTVTAPNDGAINASTRFSTANGTSATLTLPQLSSGVPLNYQGVPEAQLIASDLQQVQATQAVGATLTRTTSRYIRGPATVALTMPTDAPSPTSTIVTGAPYPRATFDGSLAAAFNGGITLSLEQAAQGRVWELSATAAGRAGGTSYSLSIPDLSGASGWQSSWALASSAVRVVSTFTGQTSMGSNNTPVAGTTIIAITRVSGFTFP